MKEQVKNSIQICSSRVDVPALQIHAAKQQALHRGAKHDLPNKGWKSSIQQGINIDPVKSGGREPWKALISTVGW